MMTMSVDSVVLHSKPAVRAAKTATRTKPARPRVLGCIDVATHALIKAGCSAHSAQPEFLSRYAELKGVTAEGLQQWLEQLAPEQMLVLRYVLETAVVDCGGSLPALTDRPYWASDDQVKLVQQFDSEGKPLWRLKLPRLNTVAALNAELSAEGMPTLR